MKPLFQNTEKEKSIIMNHQGNNSNINPFKVSDNNPFRLLNNNPFRQATDPFGQHINHFKQPSNISKQSNNIYFKLPMNIFGQSNNISSEEPKIFPFSFGKDIVEEEEEEEEEDEILFEEKDKKFVEIQKKKCSLTEHNEINAIRFCPQCNIFMCHKCDKIHSGFLQKHYVHNLDNCANNIFSEICGKKNHSMRLEYFCIDHNQLCCAICIAKSRCKKNGYHKNCKIVYINKIKNSKKRKLNENIKFLEDLSSKIEDSIKELRSNFEKINEIKDKLKNEIQNIFTKIRNSINNREEKLLSDLDKIFENYYFKEDLIKESKTLPNKIKNLLDKGKTIDNEWNNTINCCSLINDCLNIENDIKKINNLNENINNCNSNKEIHVTFKPDENGVNHFLEKINKLGEFSIQNNVSYVQNVFNVDHKENLF